MEIRIGIDLGSCYSSIAYIDPKTEELLLVPNMEGNLKTPTISVDLGKGNYLFGQEALDKIMAGEGEVVTTPARYLEYLLENARQMLKQEISSAVITVPSFYTDGERRALKEMLSQAGVDVLGMINETTAVTLSYSYRHLKMQKRLLIYKLGGGYFEAAVADIEQTNVKILGSTGSREIGGREWDEALLTYLQERFYRQFKVDFTEDRWENMKARWMTEQVKIRLSQVSEAEASISYKGNAGNYMVTRNLLSQLIETVQEMTISMVRELLSSLNITPSQIDGILFSGGSTKMPSLRQYIERNLSCKDCFGGNPDYDAVYGAAIKAYYSQKESSASPQERIHEVATSSLGMISVSLDGGWYVNSILIHKNTRIPVSKTRTFRLDVPETGTKMAVYLLQGEAATPKECQVAGKYVIEGISYVEGGKTLIEITYSYDEDGIIHISGRQRETGNTLSIHSEPLPEDMDWVHKKPELNDYDLEEVILYLCMDLSGSMAGIPFMEARKALKELVRELDLTCTKVAILGFADQSYLLLEPTNNLEEIYQALQRMRISGRRFGYGNGTSPFAYLYERYCQSRNEKEKVVMMVLSDGLWPDKDRAKEVADSCKEKGILIDTRAFGHADTVYLSGLSSGEDVSEWIVKKKDKGEMLSIAQIVSEEKVE